MFLLRLALDSVAAVLLLITFAYSWLGNVTHEIAGAAMFLLLLSHNIFNRRWYGAIMQGRREARGIATRTINLSLLVTMLALLATSVIVSETVFGFLPLTSTVTARQVHTSAGYLALLIAAIHLGLHWSLIMGVARVQLGIATGSRLRAFVLCGLAGAIAVYGFWSAVAIDLGSKLFMRTTMDFGDFRTPVAAALMHHVAIFGLLATLTHYGLKVAYGRWVRPGGARHR